MIINNEKLKRVKEKFVLNYYDEKEDKMLTYYNNSIQKLIDYINVNGIYPNELNWNRYAVTEKLLSAETIGYLYKDGFNKLCRRILIEINKNNKEISTLK